MKMNKGLSGSTKSTKVVPSGVGHVKIIHVQSIKQSLNYQSAEASYGLEVTVIDGDFSIRKGIKRAERLVEEALVSKFEKQGRLLKALAETRS